MNIGVVTFNNFKILTMQHINGKTSVLSDSIHFSFKYMSVI